MSSTTLSKQFVETHGDLWRIPLSFLLHVFALAVVVSTVDCDGSESKASSTSCEEHLDYRLVDKAQARRIVCDVTSDFQRRLQN